MPQPHNDFVDAAAKRIAESGGSIRRPPEDIPNVGRFAVVAAARIRQHLNDGSYDDDNAEGPKAEASR